MGTCVASAVDVHVTQSRCLRLRENDFEKQIKMPLLEQA